MPSLTAVPPAQKVQLVELSRGGRDLSRFLRVPYAIYKDDRNWVAPLLSDLKKVFTDANPLFEHAEMKLWVATRDGRDVGRIAGILDRTHNTYHHETTMFWGFFESENDPETATALFDAVTDWARSKQMTRLLGPMNPTTNDECGLLIDGFDAPPIIMMTYNPRYYVDLVDGAGFVKAKDLLAYHFSVDPKPLERMERLAAGVKRREPGLVVRRILKKTLRADLVKVKEVYNAAWEANWGFVPMSDADMDFMAERLKPLLSEPITLLAELNGEPVGFMMSLPDYNEAIAPLKGKLLSPKLVNFLRYLMGWKTPRWVRVVTLGIKKEYRLRGIDAAMFAQGMRDGLKMGFQECEVSWMLEDNQMVLRPIEVFNGKRYKTYRLYERPV